MNSRNGALKFILENFEKINYHHSENKVVTLREINNTEGSRR
jgi:hypothetical protein